MLKYMLLLCCLYAALTEAKPIQPKKISETTKKQNITDEINGGLEEFVDPEHKPFIPLMQAYNTGILLTHDHRTPIAIHLLRDSQDFTELLTLLGIDTRTNRRALKHFSLLKPFCEEVDRVIGLIPDFEKQEVLQTQVNQSKLKIQQRLQFPNKFFPKRISPKKARKQKALLTQFVNYQLNNFLQAQDAANPNKKDLQDLVNIATVKNLAHLYGQNEFRKLSTAKIIETLSSYSSSPAIDLETAKQYSANNKDFFASLAKYPAEIKIEDLCDETEELIKELPQELATKLEDRVLDELGIEFRN